MSNIYGMIASLAMLTIGVGLFFITDYVLAKIQSGKKFKYS